MTPVPSLAPLQTIDPPHDRGTLGNEHLLDLCDSAGTSPGSLLSSPENDLGTIFVSLASRGCFACYKRMDVGPRENGCKIKGKQREQLRKRLAVVSNCNRDYL